MLNSISPKAISCLLACSIGLLLHLGDRFRSENLYYITNRAGKPKPVAQTSRLRASVWPGAIGNACANLQVLRK